MVNILVTGSADGIGQATAAALVEAGHRVVLHARNEVRAEEATAAVPGAVGVVVGDLTVLAEIRELAKEVEGFCPLDVVVHNAGIARLREPERALTEDGFESMFQVNVLSAYLLTALLPIPDRLIYLSSAMAAHGVPDLSDPNYERRPWNGVEAYATTKLYTMMLALAVARRWPQVRSNAFDPGFVRTAMTRGNGDAAPLSAAQAGARLAWLATSNDPAACQTGQYISDRPWHPTPQTQPLQDTLLDLCATLTSTPFPHPPRQSI